MRRPVSVKTDFVFLSCKDVFLFLFSPSFLWVTLIRAEPPLSPSFHPHSLLSDGRSVQVGRTRFSRCCYLIIDLGSPLSKGVGPGLSRSHLNSAVELGYLDPYAMPLAYHFVVVPQWFIDLSAYPQLVKQYGQLPRYRHDRSFFGILSSALSKP